MTSYLSDTGTKTFAKIVNLDPQAAFSEIWGWKIRVGHSFSGYFNPVPFKYLYGRRGRGVVYQSELLDVEWNESPSSSDFFKQLKEAMGNDNINSHQLSMRFNVDVYVGYSEQSNFTTGRISGLILNNSYNQYLCLMLTFLLYAYYVLLCFGLIYQKRKLIVIKRQKISFLGL